MATDTEIKTNFLNENSFAAEDDVVQCPTCKTKIKRSEVANHCQIEVERLRGMELRTTAQEENGPSGTGSAGEGVSSSSGRVGEERRRPWSVFQRVQRNRQARQKQRTRKRNTPPPPPPPPPPSEPTCPVCNKHFPQSEIQRHANQCLRRSGRNNTNGIANGRDHNSSDDDDESGDEYEEYEWAGQKRIRVSSLLHGGYSALGLGQTIKYNGNQQTNDEEEEDLNVDEDDTHIYGPAQYGETDVIPLASEDANSDSATGSQIGDSGVTSYMRRLIASADTTTPVNNHNHSNDASTNAATAIAATVTPATSNTQSITNDTEAASSSQSMSASNAALPKPVQYYQQVIESLKAKLRLYESQAQNKFKCLICIDDYKNPAISVSCWHVYCEQCWLRTLGARKLCPQCNSITTPKDLRRIYL